MTVIPSVQRRIAIVMLSFNSEKDLMISAPQMAGQVGIEGSLIIVDNGSGSNSANTLSKWLSDWRPDAVVGSLAEVEGWIISNSIIANMPGQVFCVLNERNDGYSAGNNIGIRLAELLGSQAVLIANPDMRVNNTSYTASLADQMFANERIYIAASSVIGLDGKDQNPLRESTYWEELFWPIYTLKSWVLSESYVVSHKREEPYTVVKVSGCCLMIRMSFLRETGLLDEAVFLYCEEPILAAKVAERGGEILFVPTLTAIHAHLVSEKGDSLERMRRFIMSRRYYLEKYSSYGVFRVKALLLSQRLLLCMCRMRKLFAR